MCFFTIWIVCFNNNNSLLTFQAGPNVPPDAPTNPPPDAPTIGDAPVATTPSDGSTPPLVMDIQDEEVFDASLDLPHQQQTSMIQVGLQYVDSCTSVT